MAKFSHKKTLTHRQAQGSNRNLYLIMPDQQRKLAAIVFTDIVGFTKLTADDQQKASDLLDIQRNELKPIVESYNGKWIKEMGDGLILTFDTITNAVQSCLKIQEKAKSIENLTLRIGIHLGEILEKENDIIGDDVNVASRIEPFSAPGGIAISNKVNDALVREADFTTKYLGKPQLKGVGQKVEVFCITSHDLPETDLSQVTAKLEPEGFQWNLKNSIGVAASVFGLLFLLNFFFLRIGYADKDETPSIAILPFENKGAEADEFYAYGISSDLITDVMGAGLIRVASLGDIEKLDFKTLENSELAKKLFVRYVAKGTLWKMDSIFQLSMEIFDTKDSKVVYNKRWQTDWKDLATIKDDLSDNILETLKVEVLQDSEIDRKINPDAYELYLKFRHKYAKRKTLEDKVIAVQLLEKAVELDENFLSAKAGFASIAFHEGNKEKAIKIMLDLLDQAEKLGDNKIIKGCLISLGFYYNNSGQYEKAKPHLLRLIEIAEVQNDKKMLGSGYGNIAVTFLYGSKYNIGEIERAEKYNAKAISIKKEIGEKSSIAPSIEAKGTILVQKGDFDSALNYYYQSYDIFLELGRTGRIYYNLKYLGKAYNAKGDYTNALAYFDRALKIAENLEEMYFISNTLFDLGKVSCIQGEYEKSVDYLERSIKVMQELKKDNYEQDLATLSYLYLSNKRLSNDFDESVIRLLIKEEEKEDFDFTFNFVLFELLDDKSYLEPAHDQLLEITSWMDDELKEKFYSYPIPKRIVEAWEKVNT